MAALMICPLPWAPVVVWLSGLVSALACLEYRQTVCSKGSRTGGVRLAATLATAVPCLCTYVAPDTPAATFGAKVVALLYRPVHGQHMARCHS